MTPKAKKIYADGIHLLRAGNIPLYGKVIRESFATVARDFKLTRMNCPKHPSFIADDHLLAKFDGRYTPFGMFQGGELVGFVSLSDKGGGVFMLNNLAVLPAHRHRGHGKKLLDFCKAAVKKTGGSKITIDIIEENTALKNWYAANGFIHTGTRKYPGKPFTVGDMEWEVLK